MDYPDHKDQVVSVDNRDPVVKMDHLGHQELLDRLVIRASLVHRDPQDHKEKLAKAESVDAQDHEAYPDPMVYKVFPETQVSLVK